MSTSTSSKSEIPVVVGIGLIIALFGPSLMKVAGFPLLPIGSLGLVAIGVAVIIIGLKVGTEPITKQIVIRSFLMSFGFLLVFGAHIISGFTEIGSMLAVPGAVLFIIASYFD